MLTPRPARDNGNLRPPPWDVYLIAILLVSIEARDRRIMRLEELDRQKAVALDEQRRRAGRRAA
jgi:hypothetical protein